MKTASLWAALLLVTLPEDALSQIPLSVGNALQIPTAAVTCQRLKRDWPPTQLPEVTSFEFRVGEERVSEGRTITVSYDASGRLWLLIDHLHYSNGKRLVVDIFSVGYSAEGEPVSLVTRMEGDIGDPPSAPVPFNRSATPAEAESAKKLAAWLWEGRCS